MINGHSKHALIKLKNTYVEAVQLTAENSACNGNEIHFRSTLSMYLTGGKNTRTPKTGENIVPKNSGSQAKTY